MSIDLTTYLPQPLTMNAGEWTITSPVPTVHTGKLITAFQAIQAEQARRATTGEPPLEDTHPDGFPDTVDDLARLMLGTSEYQRLIDADCPYSYIINAATAALIYWANGANEEAVHLYHQALTDTTPNREHDPKALKTGQPTASEHLSDTGKTAPPSTRTTTPHQTATTEANTGA